LFVLVWFFALEYQQLRISVGRTDAAEEMLRFNSLLVVVLLLIKGNFNLTLGQLEFKHFK